MTITVAIALSLLCFGHASSPKGDADPLGSMSCSAGQQCGSDTVGMLQLKVEQDGEQEAEASLEILGPVVARTITTNNSVGLQSLVQSMSTEEAQEVAGGCSCTWNADYPCLLRGSCYSYSTKTSCEGAGGNFCGAVSSTPACSCTWNARYPCSLWGSCYSVTDKARCEGYGGTLCGSGPAPTPAPVPPPPPPPSSSSGGGSSSAPADMQFALDQHNVYRRKHHAPDLTWDSGLANQAQSWADKCDWKHSTMGNGENLWAGTGSFNGAAATTSWYNEITNPGYNFNSPGFSSGTGHFTQVVWKGTTKLGCAVQTCNPLGGVGWNNAKFFVCE